MPDTLSREMKGISTACKRSGTSRGIIITYDKQDKIKEDGVIINLIPLPVFISQDGWRRKKSHLLCCSIFSDTRHTTCMASFL